MSEAGHFGQLIEALRAGGSEVTVCEMRMVELADGLYAVETVTEDGEVLHASLLEGERGERMQRIFVECAPDAPEPPLSEERGAG